MQILTFNSSDLCIRKAKEILYEIVDFKTVLFLSGGLTPKLLYEILAKEEKIYPAAAGMVDERFGETHSTNSGQALREKSNERMIKNTGLLRYFEYIGIPWYPILQESVVVPFMAQKSAINRATTASNYDSQVRELFFHFPKSIAVLGIGADGHTAGIPAQNPIVISSIARNPQGISQNSVLRDDIFNANDLVTSYNDTSGTYGQRITMTFTALSMIDHLVILAFGKDKKKALGKMFTPGSLEEIPARFYNKEEISKKTILITDQTI